MTTAANADLFRNLRPGQELGCSTWVAVNQGMIDRFAEATLDLDPMHVDSEWARTKGPFGHTIAFGFLTTSLLTHLLHLAMQTDHAREPAVEGYFMNYGFDRLRLAAPVPVDSRVRGRFHVLESRRDSKDRIVVKFGCTVEIEGSEKPALVAEWLAIWVPPERH